jgi:hypothetical protein
MQGPISDGESDNAVNDLRVIKMVAKYRVHQKQNL